jgi:hypothetical protein
MTTKNFVVSFVKNNACSEAVIEGFHLKIMEIMINIDYCPDYNTSTNNKINIINEYLKKNPIFIENVIYVYGIEETLSLYNNKFGIININPLNVMTVDLATVVIDKIIQVYEIENFTVEEVPIVNI